MRCLVYLTSLRIDMVQQVKQGSPSVSKVTQQLRKVGQQVTETANQVTELQTPAAL